MKEMTLKEVQQVCLDILKDIHEFCVNNNIKYSLSGGTLLGAIRHNGFIPWDDDIDIQMTRPEYEKFIHSYKSSKGYELFSREIEGYNDVDIAFSRVCEMGKTYVNPGVAPWVRRETGVWVDILPIDGAPNDEREARKKIRKMYYYWRWSNMARVKNNKIAWKEAKSFRMLLRLALKKIVSCFIPSDFFLRYIKMCQEYDFCKYEYIANYSTMHYKFREWQPKKTMSNYILHNFEDGEYYIMQNYEISLNSLYGDYMKLPPQEKQIAHIENMYYWK